MTSKSLILLKLFKTLRDKISDHSAALTYIHSDVSKSSFLKTMTDGDCAELCEILLDLFVSVQNESNKNPSKQAEEVEMALRSFLVSAHSRIMNFCEIIMKIERNKRLKILMLLETLDNNVVAKIIAQDPTAVNFIKDCLQAVQPSVMEWLNCTENIQLLIQAESKTIPNNEDQFIYIALTLLYKCYQHALKNSGYNIEQFHPIILEKIATVAYMGHKKQRGFAIKLLNEAINADLRTFMSDKKPNLWSDYKVTLGSKYCSRMSLLVKASEEDWSLLWCLSVKLLGLDLHRGHELINYLLGVEERAFKSNDMNVRRQAFKAWKELIDNFALDTLELTPRRIKLLCTPMNANNSKTEMLILTKHEVWWHLVIKIYPIIDKFVDQVLSQFLNFCFGPLGDTPLLSTKCDIVASGGKRFVKARMLSVDSLLQLLVLDRVDRGNIPLILDERLPLAVPNAVFQSCYKSFFHCVGEAIFVVNDLTDSELDNRANLIKMLWHNSTHHIEQSKLDQRTIMYRELILVIGEITLHLKNSSLISDLLLNVILPELLEVISYLTYNENTLPDLLSKLLSPEVLKQATKVNWISLKKLIRQTIKSEGIDVYHPQALELIKTLLNKMQINFIDEETHPGIFEVWCTLAESIVIFMSDNQSINEGSTVHNFEAIKLLISFPIYNIFWKETEQMKKIVKLWKELYKQFDMRADMIKSVKPNEVLHLVTKIMIDALEKDKNSCGLIINSLNVLMKTINYGSFLLENQVPPLINLLKSVTEVVLNGTNQLEIELALKAISSLLITVYGLNQNKALVYLMAVTKNIELMLKFPAGEGVEKEIITTWETVVIVFRGLVKLLTPEFVINFKDTILLALCHENSEISSQAASLLEISKDLDQESRDLLDKLKKDAENEIMKRSKLPGLGKLKEKSGKIKANNSKTLAKKFEEKRSMPAPPEVDSQGYVVIKTDVKANINCLTERQKESFKRTRDDIPAMYIDISQSGSRNTQDIVDMFKSNTVTIEQPIQTSGNESNKENSLKKTAEVPPAGAEQSTASKSQTQTQTSHSKDEANSSIDKQSDDDDDANAGVSIVKKLNFESLEEFPDDNDNSSEFEEAFEPRKTPTYVFRGVRRRGRPNGRYLRQRAADIPETQVVTSTTRRGRGRGRVRGIIGTQRSTRSSNESDETAKPGYNLKRKGHFEHEDRYLHKRRRAAATIESSDSESEDSTESENVVAPIDENLPARTKKEMSRLRINMVFDGRMPSKLRNKLPDDFIYETGNKRYSMDGKTLRQKSTKAYEASQNEQSQELVKKRRRRHTIHEVKREETEINNKSKDDAGQLNAISSTEEENNPDSPEKSSETADDDEEVVQSSQNKNPILRSPLRKNLERKMDSPVKLSKSPQKQSTEDLDNAYLEPTTSGQDNVRKSPTKIAPIFNFSSPKGIKRTPKSKTFTPSRGAHMLDLVTKLAINEKNETKESTKIPDADMLINKKVIREPEVELIPIIKKERPLILKEPDKIGSPSGSRQEKIFNNMKNRDLTSSPPSKLFNNLKNDGEKISPREKNYSRELNNSEGTELKDSDCSTSFEREPLPMLEWSNANPPSLTASPSSSILKRSRTVPLDSEIEILAKKKRVSFADPPVSKEMGYEVISTMSPVKLNKFGSPRSIAGRKDTPLRIKQSKFRIIQVDAEKVAQSAKESKEINAGVVESQDKQEDRSNKGYEEVLEYIEIAEDNVQKRPKTAESLKLLEDDDTDSADDLEQAQQCAPATSAPYDISTQDIFPPDSQPQSSHESSKLNISDAMVISLLDSSNERIPQALEDTVDINNMSSLNSTGNSDELFCSKPARTSTAMIAVSEGDTLPVTDSIFLSQGSSQGTQLSLGLPQPEIMDSTNPICPNLLNCDDSVNSIVDSLVNPLWSTNLSKYFASRSINTIGDLAQLSEREVARIPVKGSPKVAYVKTILDKFYLSNISAIGKASSTPRKTQKKLNTAEKSLEINPDGLGDTLSLETANISGYSVMDDKSNVQMIEDVIDIKEESIECVTTGGNDGYGSAIVDTSIETPKKADKKQANIAVKKHSVAVMTEKIPETTTKSVGVQMELGDLLDEMDSKIVLRSAMKRCTSAAIFAQYKIKMKHRSGGELAKDIMRLLGIDSFHEGSLRTSCRDMGLPKVLARLADIYSSDKQYFTKVLNTYRMKIKADDCLTALDFGELKKAISIKCSAPEICELMSTVLAREEAEGINTPITGVSSMNAMLRRMPIDSIISQTVANDELIPPPVVLEIALQNNRADVVAQALESHFPRIVKKVLDKNENIVSYIKEENVPKDTLLELYQVICDKLSAEELIKANHKIITKKLGFTTDSQ